MIDKFEKGHWYIFRCNDKELLKNRRKIKYCEKHNITLFKKNKDFVLKEKYLKCHDFDWHDHRYVAFSCDSRKWKYFWGTWVKYFFDVTKLIKYKKFLTKKL